MDNIYYQAVYQTDAHGFNVVYSAKIWETEEEALHYLDEVDKELGDGVVYKSWVDRLTVVSGR